MNRFVEQLDRWTNHIRLQPKLLITFYFISIVPLVITAAFFYLTLTQSLEDEVGTSMVQTTRQVEERINSFMEETTHLANIIQFDSNTQAFLGWEDPADLFITPNLQALRNLITTITNQRTHLRSIYIVNDHGRYIFASQGLANMEFDFLNDPWYMNISKQKGFKLLPVHIQNYAQGAPVVTFEGRIFKVSDLKETGTLMFDFDREYLSNMIETIRVGQTGSVFLISEDGNSVASLSGRASGFLENISRLPEFGEEEGYILKRIDGVNMLIGFSSSKSTGWKIVAAVPFQEVSGKIEALKWAILVLVCLAILIIVVLAKYLSQAITNPMILLTEYMRRVEKGDLSVRVPVERRDELGLLTRRFNHMLEQIQDLQEVVYHSEIRETKLHLLNRESELKALQMQINPHFLHNTLNTMKCVGEVYDVKEVTVMSEGLAEMFRYSIDTDKFKLIGQELDHVQAYIQIIQVRYPDRIQCHYEIPEHLNEFPILKLILQPLVENAIEHGLIPKVSKGNIWISARTDRGQLVLMVADDGVGLTGERLMEIKRKLEGLRDGQLDAKNLLAGHIGLVNVSQRLYLNYGDTGILRIESDPRVGTVVEIRLPIEEELEE